MLRTILIQFLEVIIPKYSFTVSKLRFYIGMTIVINKEKIKDNKMSLMPVIYTSLVIFLTLLIFLVFLSWIVYKAKARGRKLPHEKYEQELPTIQYLNPEPAKVIPTVQIPRKIQPSPVIIKSNTLRSRTTQISEKPRKRYAPRFSTLNEFNFRDVDSRSGKRYSQTEFSDMRRVTILNNPISTQKSQNQTQSESVKVRDASKINIIKYYTDNPEMNMMSIRAAGY